HGLNSQMCPVLSFLFFFFSSRRRHTRSKRDWSSDVCSSDLSFLEAEFCTLEKLLKSSRINSGSKSSSNKNRSLSENEIKYINGRSEERRVGKECKCRRWLYQ